MCNCRQRDHSSNADAEHAEHPGREAGRSVQEVRRAGEDSLKIYCRCDDFQSFQYVHFFVNILLFFHSVFVILF